MNLNERAMLVSQKIPLWSARRHDKKASEEVASNHGTQAGRAGRYNKCLVDPQDPTFKAIQQAADAARAFHYKQTLPWVQNGAQILPSENYLSYMTESGRLESRFRAAVAEFINEFPTIKDQARIDLNGLYREDDYPTVAELRRKYDYQVVVLPFPDPDDFRVKLADADAALVRTRIEKQVEEALNLASRDLWDRLHEIVKRYANNLSNPEGRFSPSMVDDARALCALLPRLNLKGDGRLEAMRLEVETRLAHVSAEVLKTDPDVRHEVATNARRMVASVNDMMSAFG